MTVYQGQKFKEYLDKNSISAAKAAEILSVSRQNIYGLFKSANLSTETVKKILDKFSITEDEIWPYSPRIEAKLISFADPDGEHRTGEKIYSLPDGQKIMEVKIVPAKGQAGYMRGFPDPEYYEDLPTLTISVNGNHSGTYLAFEVVGDSMTPTSIDDIGDAILDGWHVVGRELPKQHWMSKLHTHSHSYWIIVHKDEGILIKNIKEHNVENGTITIHSLNPKYKDEILKLDDIKQIFSGIKRIVNDR